MLRGKPFEIRSAFSSASVCIVAFPMPRCKGGYYISRTSLLRAKSKMGVPSWSTVNLLRNRVCDEIYVIADDPGNDEVIKCAN